MGTTGNDTSGLAQDCNALCAELFRRLSSMRVRYRTSLEFKFVKAERNLDVHLLRAYSTYYPAFGTDDITDLAEAMRRADPDSDVSLMTAEQLSNCSRITQELFEVDPRRSGYLMHDNREAVLDLMIQYPHLHDTLLMLLKDRKIYHATALQEMLENAAESHQALSGGTL